MLNQEIQQSGLNINSYGLFNQLLKEERGKRLYKAGNTKPVSALRLHLEAERNIQHSSKLWRNMKSSAKANDESISKPAEYETYHIAAARAPRADKARGIMFSVGIGINSWENGVNLHHAPHRELHTVVYYIKVNQRLLRAQARSRLEIDNQIKRNTVSNELRAMAEEIEEQIF